MNINEAFSRLETELPPLLVLSSPESFLVEEWKKAWLARKNPALLAMNFETLDGRETELATLLESIATVGWTEGRIVWVSHMDLSRDGLSKHKALLEGIFKHRHEIPKDNHLVLESGPAFRGKFWKSLEKEGAAWTLDPLTPRELRHWIEKKLHRAGRNCQKKTIDYLVDRLGYFDKNREVNLYDLSGELEKLKEGEGELTVTEIDEKLVTSWENSIFKLTDSLHAGKVKEALTIYHELLMGEEDPMRIFYMLVRHVRNLTRLRIFREERLGYEIGRKESGLSPFEYKKVFQASEHFRASSLMRLYHDLYDTESHLKDSGAQPEIQVERFLIKIARSFRGR